jgi:hypothetical protein
MGNYVKPHEEKVPVAHQRLSTTSDSFLSRDTPRYPTSSHPPSFVYSIKAQDLPPIFRTHHHLFLRKIGNLLRPNQVELPSDLPFIG